MRNKVLIVDDMKFNRQVLADILRSRYEILEAENGKEALAMIEAQRQEIAAVLLDIVMPEMDGVTLLKMLNEKQLLGDYPIVVVTGEQSMEMVVQCFDYGISDLIRKPVNTAFVMQRVTKLIALYRQQNEYKEKLAQQSITLRKQFTLLRQQTAQLKAGNAKMINVLGSMVETRNLEKRAHVERVKEFTAILGKHMMKDYPEYGLTEERVYMIASCSALHDIGKILIPDSILLKPGKLTDDEFEYIKSHSLRGYEIACDITDVWDEEYGNCIKEITRSHHEKYDGRGYPDGLKGDAIPISAQLVSIADCFESLISESVYKEAIPYDEAYDMIVQGECGVFSYKLLECFRKARTELVECAEKYAEE